MTLNTWNRVEELFLSAADLPAAKQQGFLEAQCPGDAKLRDKVLAMLKSDLRQGASIQNAVEREASRMFEAVPPASRLGAYRVEHEIGRGGMGAVYLATRDDDQFQKRVAIKVIKRGTDTDEALARFRDERQILANLDHPYIARLLDAGTTSDGRPFFVMEYVEGLPVDVFCRDHQLDVKARCRLFLKICEAVSYAHRNLVIHRDLKPANIFITADSTPKLLDFGVAKLLGPAASSAQTTSILGRPFTPDYASPEQALGLPVTTASDVYSLGAVLYELLTGHRAQPIRQGASPGEIEHAICEVEPVPPSLIAAGLDADLNNIVLAAMRKETERRYRSVDQLGEDVRSYLEMRPVLARRTSIWYRFSKFARRQRYALGAVTAVVVSLILGIVIAFSEARQAKTARTAAELNLTTAISERRRAEERLAQIVGMSDRSLSDVYALMERLPGSLSARKEFVSNTLTFLENLAKDAGGNPKLQFALALAYSRLGEIQGDLDSSHIGDTAGALRSYRAASELIGDPGSDPDRLALWAELRDKTAKILPDFGDRKDAQQILRETIRRVDAARSLPPAVADKLRAELHLSLSRTLLNLPEALAEARQSLAATEKAAQNDAAMQYTRSIAETQIAFVHLLMGDPAAAEPFYLEAMKLREHLAREHPEDLVYRRALRLSYEHYAALLADPDRVNLGRPDLARAYFEKARPLEEASAADPQNSLAKFDYALFLLDSARIEQPPEEMEKSLARLHHAAAICVDLLQAEPGVMRYGRALSTAHEALGRRLAEMSRYPEALAEYDRAIGVEQRMLSADRRDLVLIRDEFHTQLGRTRILTLAGNREAALDAARKSGECAAQLGPAELAESNLALAIVYKNFGECQRSADLARKVLSDLPRERQSAALIRQAQDLLTGCRP